MKQQWKVVIHEIRKVTFEVEMEQIPYEDDTYADLEPEQRAIMLAIEGSGIEKESEFIDILDSDSDITLPIEKYGSTAERVYK